MTFEAWDKLINKRSLVELINEGKKLLIARNQEVCRIVDNATTFVEFEGCYVPLIECEPKFMSDVGNILSLDHAFVLMFQRKPGMILYSMRSNADNPRHVDVSEIAKKYGGGGHKHAAGFKVSQPLF